MMTCMTYIECKLVHKHASVSMVMFLTYICRHRSFKYHSLYSMKKLIIIIHACSDFIIYIGC